jgi:acyl carrier protein phosphodiesterase
VNWLAHTLLSTTHIEHQLGNILADPMKCKPWHGIPYRMRDGMQTHMLIDTYTDTHPLIKESKAYIQPDGYFKGVVLDVLYDYFLSIHWDKFATIDKDNFLDIFHNNAYEYIQNNPLPHKARNVIKKVINNKQLSSYSSLDGVQAAFKRIDARLSSRAIKKDNTTNYLPYIIENKSILEEKFLEFFPQLQLHISQYLKHKTPNYWKIKMH